MSEQESGQVSEQVSEQEKKAIEILRFSPIFRGRKPENDCLEIVLNLIGKLQKENTELKEKLENNIIEPLNAYKLMEAPYMAKLLKEQRYDEFMEHLKQSEVEIANKVIELIEASNKK